MSGQIWPNGRIGGMFLRLLILPTQSSPKHRRSPVLASKFTEKTIHSKAFSKPPKKGRKGEKKKKVVGRLKAPIRPCIQQLMDVFIPPVFSLERVN
jgi:hypothetical protein